MPTLAISDDQVVDLIKQLPEKRKRDVFYILKTSRDFWWESLVNDGEDKLRQVCTERGLNWDAMNEDEREDFIDVLMHED